MDKIISWVEREGKKRVSFGDSSSSSSIIRNSDNNNDSR